MSETPSSLIGQEIGGRYRIVRLLGEGGMGSVFLGEQKLGTTLRKVAIKTLHPHLSHDPKILARFERECETIAELQHPNTIQVYDFGKTDDGTLYIVMEYVEGRSVAELLEQEGPMEPTRVTKIMTQVCGSLEEAHSRGIVHRDLKPDNVVLCERAGQKDWVEVLDFGIAKRSSEHDPNEQKLTQQGMVLGTPPYMSPEQFTGKPIDARSDIYSLGVMSYEMLTGRLPFSGNTAWEWATQHMTARPVAIESLPVGTRVPPAMRAAINRALAKTPEERFATVKDFIDAFGSDGHAVQYSAPPVESPRQKTEMTPMQAPSPGGAAVGVGAVGYTPTAVAGPGPGQYAPPPPMQHAPAVAPYGAAGTPASGHQAFATGSANEKKGPPRGLIFGAIAVLGIGSVGLVLAGLGVFSGSKTDPGNGNIFGNTTATTAPPPTAPTETVAPTVTAPTNAAVVGTVSPLKPPTTATKTPTKTPTTTPPVQSAPVQTPPPVQPPPVQPPPVQPPPVQPPPVQPPPPVVKPPIPECLDAAKWCRHPAMGTDKSIQNLCVKAKSACFNKGGNF